MARSAAHREAALNARYNIKNAGFKDFEHGICGNTVCSQFTRYSRIQNS